MKTENTVNESNAALATATDTPKVKEAKAKLSKATVLDGVEISEMDAQGVSKLILAIQSSKMWAGRNRHKFELSETVTPTTKGARRVTTATIESSATKEEKARVRLVKAIHEAFKQLAIIEGGEVRQSLADAKAMRLFEGAAS